MLNDVDFAADMDSIVALVMAAIFFAGFVSLMLPSARQINGLKPYLAAMLITAALLFLSSASWLLVANVLNSPYTALFIWLRILCRTANALATLVFVYRVVRYESPI